MKFVLSALFLFGSLLASSQVWADEASEQAAQEAEEHAAMMRRYEARIRQLERYSVQIVSGMQDRKSGLTADAGKERNPDGLRVTLMKSKKKS